MIVDVEDYFVKGCGRCVKFNSPQCSVNHWNKGLRDLREICRKAGLSETAKWGHPCYVHAGRNIAIIGAFRTNFRLNFFNAGLLKDPEGVLEPNGPNTRNPGVIRFESNDAVVAMSTIITSYLKEAMVYSDEGKVAPKTVNEPEMPVELLDALDADPELAEAFDRLTPGRRKSYAFNLNAAKKSETRMNRIAKFRSKIIAGKGALER